VRVAHVRCSESVWAQIPEYEDEDMTGEEGVRVLSFLGPGGRDELDSFWRRLDAATSKMA
jgi:hypothetical protein